jgi:hypothetical protein
MPDRCCHDEPPLCDAAHPPTTPNTLHAPIAQAAIAAGKHVVGKSTRKTLREAP